MAPRRALGTRSPRPAPAIPGPGGRAGAMHWSDVLASLADAVIVVDTALRVTYVNQAAESLTGTAAAHATDRPLDTWLRRDTWLLDMIRETLTNGDGRRRGEGTLTRPHQPLIPVAATVSPTFGPADALEGAVVVLHDLRYRKDLEDLARHADRATSLEFLSAGLAHEIKNPLGAIKGAAQLLAQARAPSPAAVRDHVAIIVREVDRLSRLLNELRDLTHPPTLVFSEINIHKVLHDVLAVARAHPDWQQTELVQRFDPSLPEVRASEPKLQQVFLNLVINAVHAMAGRGVLTISTRMVTDYHIRAAAGVRGRFLSVDLEDTGSGLPAGDPADLFAPFFTTKPGGSGLGLAISRQIVHQHDGRISVQPATGGGAHARVMLPVGVAPRTP